MSDLAFNVSIGPSSARGTGVHALGLLVGAALLCGGAVLALTAATREPPRAVEPAPAAVAESWIAIARPVQVYSFEAPAFRGLPATYAARRHTLGGGREDALALGSLGNGAPMLRLTLFRPVREAPDGAPLAAALVRAAADTGLSVAGRTAPRQDAGRRPEDWIATRFGRVEVADLALSNGVRSASCSGFRLALARPALALTGLACAAGGMPMPRRTLGCLIERLDLASARDDRELIDFFAASELRRDAGCAGMGLGPNAAHAAWLDDISDTAKKSSRRR